MAKLNSIQVSKILKNSGLKVFSPIEFSRLFNISYNTGRKFLWRYSKKDFITKLKNGLYILTDQKPGEFLIANKLYSPSCISLETALAYYHIIPETIYAITSVTTQATREFNVASLHFSYSKIKKQAFSGYIPIKIWGDTVFIAEMEKALADYLYFISLGKKELNDRINLQNVSSKKLAEYTQLFNYKPLNKLVETLI